MITDYINNNGFIHGYSTLSCVDAKKISSEYWDSNSGSLVTIGKVEFDLVISFDHNFKKMGEYIVSWDVSNSMLVEVMKFESLFLNVFEDRDEVVIFFKNNINVHLQKSDSDPFFSQLRIISNPCEGSRPLVRNLMDEVELCKAEKLILR